MTNKQTNHATGNDALEAYNKMLITEQKCINHKKLKNDAAYISWAKEHRETIRAALERPQVDVDLWELGQMIKERCKDFSERVNLGDGQAHYIAKAIAAQGYLSDQSAWQPIESAPKDGSIVMLMKWHDKMPTVYSAWWMKGDKYETQDGTEYEGNNWVLNDDDDQLIEEYANLSVWYWMPLTKHADAIKKAGA